MTVKQGYKLTEVGVIPEDWEVALTQDVLVFQGGSQPEKSYFSQSKKFGFIRLIQIRDYKTDKFETYIPQKLARRFCSEDDIMIGRYGPPIFQILKGIEGAYNVALIKAQPQQNIQSTFAYYFLKQEKLFRFIENLSKRSSGQTGIDLHELKKYPLGLPNLPEQTAIANALSDADADAYINSLEQLIAKKQQIKQGTMQELLTGKKRLEGFSGEWEEKKLGDFAHCYSGGTPSTSVPEYYNGNIPWITSSDLNRQYIFEVNGRLSEIGLKNSSAQIVKKDCLLIALYGATAGVSAITKIEAAINQAVLAVIFNEQNTYFFYFLFSLLKTKLIETYTQGGQPNLSGAIIKSIQLRIPTLPEQTAIANILTHMDNDIQALQNKLTKAKHIKQGMMQELLTGKTRLVQPH